MGICRAVKKITYINTKHDRVGVVINNCLIAASGYNEDPASGSSRWWSDDISGFV